MCLRGRSAGMLSLQFSPVDPAGFSIRCCDGWQLPRAVAMRSWLWPRFTQGHRATLPAIDWQADRPIRYLSYFVFFLGL